MAIQEKYQGVIDTINQSGGRNVNVKEENGVLKVTATVKGPDEKNKVWNKIKEIGGENPTDISADITMDNVGNQMASQATGTGGSGVGASGKSYTVKSGDTLSKIAKEMLGDSSRYMDIFNANKDQLTDPDKIKPGQELKIP